VIKEYKNAFDDETLFGPATAALFSDSFQDSEAGNIPKGWEVAKLKELTSKIEGTECETKKVKDEAWRAKEKAWLCVEKASRFNNVCEEGESIIASLGTSRAIRYPSSPRNFNFKRSRTIF
jgi:hypothetical protein